MEITDHPVETGSSITDHAYKRPSEVVIRCAFSNSPQGSSSITGSAFGAAAASLGTTAVGALASLGGSAVRTALGAAQTVNSILSGDGTGQARTIYESFLALQSGRGLIDVYTGKRVYRNMLIKSLAVTTDKHSENALFVTATCREILFATTATVDVPLAQANPIAAKWGAVKDFGQRQLDNAPSTILNFLPR
jgi:hypothetical protein